MSAPRRTRAERISPGPGVHDAGDERERFVAAAVARAKQGDTSALQVLYIRYGREVYRWVNSIVRDHHEAEDITQGVFLKLMRVIGSYTRRDDVPFSAWLRRVARNAALENLRSRRAMPVRELDRRLQSRDDIRSEHVRDLRDALEEVPYDQREVLILRHLAGLSPCEIAQMLGKTEASIHGLQHRARNAFKKALRELEATPMTKS
jgi:RNA polymerase sigma-70 factor, ECF subfamily